MEQEKEPSAFMKYKSIIGLFILLICLLIFLAHHFYAEGHSKTYSFCMTLALITGLVLCIPLQDARYYIFDNKEFEANETPEALIEKIRFRALLLNNISVGILIVNIGVIITGFYLLIDPPVKNTPDPNLLATTLTIRISASVLLIFLVQILFKVFKYILRVAAFYNGKADALEFNKLRPDIEFEKIINAFTPDQYDISDLQQTSVTDNLVDLVKPKS
jgi:hypothetical protein